MGDINWTSLGWPPAPGPEIAVGPFTLATHNDGRLEVFALGGPHMMVYEEAENSVLPCKKGRSDGQICY